MTDEHRFMLCREAYDLCDILSARSILYASRGERDISNRLMDTYHKAFRRYERRYRAYQDGRHLGQDI